jgi:hypothetical protein
MVPYGAMVRTVVSIRPVRPALAKPQVCGSTGSGLTTDEVSCQRTIAPEQPHAPPVADDQGIQTLECIAALYQPRTRDEQACHARSATSEIARESPCMLATIPGRNERDQACRTDLRGPVRWPQCWREMDRGTPSAGSS